FSAARIAETLGQPAPTPEQTAVIEAGLEPMLVIAGAGSGKTETMASRVVHLVANGMVAPSEILGLTFTRKAASELSLRIRSRLRPRPRRPSGDRPGCHVDLGGGPPPDRRCDRLRLAGRPADQQRREHGDRRRGRSGGPAGRTRCLRTGRGTPDGNPGAAHR